MSKLVDRVVSPLLTLPRATKRGIALTVDVALCVLTVWLAFYLRLGEWVSLSEEGGEAAIAAVLLAPPIFIVFGLYRAVFRYVGWEALVTVVQGVTVYGLIYSALFTAWGVDGIPRTIGLIQPGLLLIAIGAVRAFGRYWLGGGYKRHSRRHGGRNVLIYGAGSAGQQLAAALARTEMRVVGYIDDSRGLWGSILGGARIFSPDQIADVVSARSVDEIFLAIPSAPRSRRNEILRTIRATGVAVQTLPGLLDLASGRVSVEDLRPLDIEDLLGRDPVAAIPELVETSISGQVVLVTGAGGSIGSELCRQICAAGAKTLVLVEASEYALYSIHAELSKTWPELFIVPVLGSVWDERRMRAVMARWLPDTVFHAAAYKHVPLVEHNALEGIRNNTFGTLVCATAASAMRVKRFVLISTDKAVRPTNVMGASKRLSELVLQALAKEGSGTVFAMVRFGNVLGSSGSVVPLFRQQIQHGGPVTVTHREITRYFMTIPEAAELVIQAGSMAQGGEVFVLDMGEPVKVAELARRMIEVAGLSVKDINNPDGDIEIEFTGLRPGEKLYEELLIGNDPTATSHPRILKAKEKLIPWGELEPELADLKSALEEGNIFRSIRLLAKLVAEYQPSEDAGDHAEAQRAATLRIVP